MSSITNRGEFLAGIAEWVQHASETTVAIAEQGGQEIRNQAVLRTPVKTGVLRAGWQVRSSRRPDGATVDIYNNVNYSAHIEYGTKAYTIYPKSGKVLAFQMNGKTVFAKSVNHPGIRFPKPMLRPAVDMVVPAIRRKLGV